MNDSIKNKDSIYDIAEELMITANRFKMKASYISDQTGIPVKDVKFVLQLGNEKVNIKTNSELNKYYDIAEKMKLFFNKESVSGNYYSTDNDEYFWWINQQLRDELGYYADDLIGRIKENIRGSFELQDLDESADFTDFLVNKYGIDGYCKRSEALTAYNDPDSEHYKKLTDEIIKYREDYAEFCKLRNIDSTYSRKKREKRSLERLNTHTIAKKDFAFNADQQRAILEAYYEKCTDDDGYLLPDHFGSGIQLLDFIEEKPIFKGNWKKIKVIKRAEPWATEANLKQYNWGKKLPDINENDPVYQLVLLHERVFFINTSAEQTYEIIKMIKNAPNEVKNQVFVYLKDKFGLFTPKSKKERDYYKTLAEYYDILSLKTPVANASEYSKEKIYRLLYEIAAASNGKLKFSNEIVEQAYIYLKFKAIHWTFHMYIYHFLFKYKSIDTLLLFIEEKFREYDNRDREIE